MTAEDRCPKRRRDLFTTNHVDHMLENEIEVVAALTTTMMTTGMESGLQKDRRHPQMARVGLQLKKGTIKVGNSLSIETTQKAIIRLRSPQRCLVRVQIRAMSCNQ